LNLGLGYLGLGSIGLILSSFLAQLVVVILFIKKFKFKGFSIKGIIASAKRYDKFPKITLPHSLFSTASQNLPIWVISKFFCQADLGYFSFGNRIVMMPLGLISSAYYQVFFQSFKDERDKLRFYKDKFKQVNLIFLPLFIILWFFLPDLFAFIFSEKWRVAGVYSQIMLPLFYLKFLSNLFTTTVYIYYEKQLENFMLGILITFFIILSLMIGVYFGDIKIGLVSMTILNGSVIFLKLYRSYKFVKDNDVRYI